jgi:hypothetical protein
MKYSLFGLIAFLLCALICMAEVPATEISREQILSESPQWQRNYDGFQPESEIIKTLKSNVGNDLRIEIYLGLWCPDSRHNVPPFLKILDGIGAAVPIRCFSVQRKPNREMQYFVDKVQVERVPTFIFYRGEKEIGRIVENPNAGLAEDMLAIVSK